MKIPYNQLKTLTPQFWSLRNISKAYQCCSICGKGINKTAIKPISEAKVGRRSTSTTKSNEENNTFLKKSNTSLAMESRSFSILPKKNLNFPIKCRLKCNETGQPIAEPYIAKEPTEFTIKSITKDTAMNFDDECNKLRCRVFKNTITECYQKCSDEYTKGGLNCPNALTNYLKKNGHCSQVFRVQNEDPPFRKTSNSTNGKENENCSSELFPESTDRPKTNYSIREDTNTPLTYFMSKIKPNKSFRSSGFMNDELIHETLCKLRAKTSSKSTEIEKLMSTDQTSKCNSLSNCHKSFGKKFRVQSLPNTVFKSERNFHSGSEISGKVADACAGPETSVFFLPDDKMRKNCLIRSAVKAVQIGDNMTDLKLIPNIQKKQKIVPNELKSRKKQRKMRKKTANKVKKPKNGVRRKKRRSRYWFSRIPIEPNVKGSVIFANGNAQVLDDPCRILSVNFCNSDDVLLNFRKTEMRKNFNCIEQHNECSKCSEINEIFEENLKNKKVTCGSFSTAQMHIDKSVMTTPIRQRKVSRLDKATNSYVTTVIPANPPTKSAKIQIRQCSPKKTPNRSKSDPRSGSPGKLANVSTKYDETFRNPANFTSQRTCKYKSVSSIDPHLPRVKESAKILNKTSFIQIKDVRETEGSSDESKNISAKNLLEMSVRNKWNDQRILPAVTRPVTQKPAHLNILKSKPFSPISNLWKHSGQNYQQTRRKSTGKSVPSWRSRCDCEEVCTRGKKDENVMELPGDYDYDKPVSKEMLRKWTDWRCPIEKDAGCPITNDDLKDGPPCKRPPSASALNRCNFEECRNRLRCRRPVSRCRNISKRNKPYGSGQ